ncbi:MAG TPA: hypothetical protein VN890_01850 [Methylocella sp.]|nr:hypothetical protein [Methylocella sp.]
MSTPTTQSGDSIRWHDSITKNKTLIIYPTPAVKTFQWYLVFKNAIKEFNNFKAGVTFTIEEKIPPEQKQDWKECWPGTNVQFDVCVGKTEYTACNQKQGPVIIEDGLCKGTTLPVEVYARSEKGTQHLVRVKAFIMMPPHPISTVKDPSGHKRLVGDGVKLVMAVHELIHACGLNKHSNQDVDVFSATFVSKLGPSDKQDVAMFGQREMPPISLSDETASRIQKIWE